MTDPLLSLESERVSVQPGGQARVTVRITNPGTIVEAYALDVVGDGPAQWAEVTPPTVSIYPQQETSVVVVFSPPAGAGAAGGLWPFGVRAQSKDDPAGSAVVEGDLDISRLVGLQAKLVPVTSSGRWRGRHTVQLSNWGNTAVRLRLVAADPDEALGFLVRPEEVDLQLGASTTARVHVRTRHPVLRGTAPRLPFTVTAERTDVVLTPGPTPVGAAPDRPVLNGAFQQRPIVSGAAVLMSLLLLAGLVAGAVFTFNGKVDEEASGYKDVSTPPKPEISRAKAVGPTAIEVVWKPLKDMDAYRVAVWEESTPENIFKDTSVAAPVNVHTQPDLTPGTTYCFRVTAVEDDLAGPGSEPECATTPVPEPSPSPSPSATAAASPSGSASSSPSAGGSPSTSPTALPGDGTNTGAAIPPGQWVLVVAADLSTDPQTRVEALAELLGEEGIQDVGTFRSGDYPDLESSPPGLRLNDDAWVVYAGVAGSPEALDQCDEVQKVRLPSGYSLLPGCRPVKPEP